MSGKVHYEKLDAMRGVASLIVLVGHATSSLAGWNLFSSKGVAVVFFFSLSGFVMAASYESRLTSGLKLRPFMVSRLWRLMPLIILAGIFSFLVQLATSSSSTVSPRLLLDFLGAITSVPTPGFALNPPQWSLFCELSCYILFGAGVYKLKSRTLLVVGIVVGCLFIGLKPRFNSSSLFTGLLSSFSGFAIGMVMYRLRARNMAAPNQGLTALVIASAIALVFLAMTPVSSAHLASAICLWVLAPTILWAGSSSLSDRSIYKWLGLTSYPLYVLHFPVLVLVRIWVLPALGGVVATITAIFASISVAVAAEFLFDHPIRQWVKRKSSRSTVPQSLTIDRHGWSTD